MMNTTKLLAVAAIALIGCGDNKSSPDARVIDSAPADAYCSSCPAAPTIGMQIDRMGRAAVNTVLNNGFNPDATTAQAAKKAYNEASDLTAWFSMFPEFAKNLALIDVLDTGAQTGCGNQAMYNGGAGSTPAADSYHTLAKVLANDQLFVLTSNAACTSYLAVESTLILGPNTSCGGRAPQYDVIDYSYSMLAAGVSGFTISGTSVTPKIGDGVGPHDDYLADFPYLGPPM